MYYLSQITRSNVGIFLISEDIKNQVNDQRKSAGSFARQLDESTDVLFSLQVIAFVRYVNNDVFKDQFLYILDLPSRIRRKDFFETIGTFSR